MARFIIFLFLGITLIIVVFNFVVGFLRRMLGLSPRNQAKHDPNTPKKVLYEKDGTVVLKGESTERPDDNL